LAAAFDKGDDDADASAATRADHDRIPVRAAVVIVVVMVGFRVMPAYIEYYSIQKALEKALSETKDLNSAAEIRNAFQRVADAGYIEVGFVQGHRDNQVEERGHGQRRLDAQAADGSQREHPPRIRGDGDQVITHALGASAGARCARIGPNAWPLRRMPLPSLLDRLGHSFRKPELLRVALTHRSHGAMHNERLEFIGDAVLNCVAAAVLFERFPAIPEGELTRVRASLVNRDTLARLARGWRWAKKSCLGAASFAAAARPARRSSRMRSKRSSAPCSSMPGSMPRGP
jgi:hypothetical protein